MNRAGVDWDAAVLGAMTFLAMLWVYLDVTGWTRALRVRAAAPAVITVITALTLGAGLA